MDNSAAFIAPLDTLAASGPLLAAFGSDPVRLAETVYRYFQNRLSNRHTPDLTDFN